MTFDEITKEAESFFKYRDDVPVSTLVFARHCVDKATKNLEPDDEPINFDNCRLERMCRRWCGHPACLNTPAPEAPNV